MSLKDELIKGLKTVTTKKDIIALLMNSKKITKKKIEDKLFGPSKKT